MPQTKSSRANPFCPVSNCRFANGSTAPGLRKHDRGSYPMTAPLADIKSVIEKHWGYRSFRPLQEPAMTAVLEGRDSLVVLPTGGGKSLCYQAPAVLRGGTTVVISPLISLMKDQVDGLRACGVAAAQIDSSLSSVERYAYETDLVQGAI